MHLIRALSNFRCGTGFEILRNRGSFGVASPTEEYDFGSQLRAYDATGVFVRQALERTTTSAVLAATSPGWGTERIGDRALRLLLITAMLVFLTLNEGFPQDQTALAGRQHDQARELIKKGRVSEAIPLLEKALKETPENKKLMADYVSTLVWNGDYSKAVQYYSARERDLREITYLPRNIAKAFYELRDFRKARALYERAYQYDKHDAEAFKGLIYTLCRLQNYLAAENYLAEARRARNIPAETLAHLQVYLAWQMGASFQGWQYAQARGVKDKALLGPLLGDMAVERLKWEETDRAIHLLEGILQEDPENFRARGDYLVALSIKGRMREVLEQYRIMEATGAPLPFWVTGAVGDAYLYLKQPKKAAAFYRVTLEKNPDNPFRTLLNLYQCYLELREWAKAEETWNEIDNLLKRQRRTDNLLTRKIVDEVERPAADTSWGWFLIYQDRLPEAQAYFHDRLSKAGLDTGFRTGLAQVYYYRGWPRAALEEFKIAENIDPKDINVQVGLAATLNELNYKREALALGDRLYAEYPYNYFVRELRDTLQLNNMYTISGDFNFVNEFPGVTQYFLRSRLSAPLAPTLRLFGDISRLESNERTGGQQFHIDYNRLGVGLEWIALPQLTLAQAVSFDYLTGSNVGSFTAVSWRPTDTLKAAASFNSFSLELPLRAQATGVKGKRGLLDLSYRQSELFKAGLSLGGNWLTDGNFNPFVGIRAERNLITTPSVKLGLGGEFYYDRYSKPQNDVPYFSPLFEYSFLVGPTLRWDHYVFYDRKVSSIIAGRVGLYKEHGFDFFPVGGVTYGQDISFSKTFALSWSVSYDLRVYDGNYTHALGAALYFKKYF